MGFWNYDSIFSATGNQHGSRRVFKIKPKESEQMKDTLFTNDGWMFNFEVIELDELSEEMVNELAEENQDDN